MTPTASNALAEVLTLARGLSLDVAATSAFIGGLLWLFGWRFHRFWIVLSITATSGIVGLVFGQTAGLQVLAVGLLLAVISGLLALHLARVFAVVGAGLATMVAADTLAPNFKEPLLSFLAGGLLGVLLFRLLTMVMTSLLGGSVMLTGGLLAMEKMQSSFDAVTWANDNAKRVAIGLGVVTLLGVILQGAVERQLSRPKGKAKPKAKAALKSVAEAA